MGHSFRVRNQPEGYTRDQAARQMGGERGLWQGWGGGGRGCCELPPPGCGVSQVGLTAFGVM